MKSLDEEKRAEQVAVAIDRLMLPGRRLAMKAFGAEYGMRVAPFREMVRGCKERWGRSAVGVVIELNELQLAGILDPTTKALVLAAAYDEHRAEEKAARR